MNVKEWLEKGTNLTWKELRYIKSPPLPYEIFIDELVYRGADELNNIIEHNISLEHYSENIDSTNEKIIEDFLDEEELHFEKNREWLNEEELYVTVYSLETFLEKVRKEGIENA